ncbi:MAG: DUF1028 domain-containing protein [Flavobacteriaceae bacterium]|nr:DUF1028 domain-containing protein [Flavobacteriaceae bacterium]
MKKLIILILLATFVIRFANSQDTFSIVAVDSVTGEVGSAGASCVDLYQAGFPNDDFLGQLIPNVGAINTQAYYMPANQTNATNRMNLGETPNQIISWLVENDVQSLPQFRQYGIAAIINGSPEAAAHTGSSTDNYKNHIVGSYYSIQGNILLGQEVLDSMESRFLNESGDLVCKLMAALQGANMIGADTRCASNGTSSLFAFVKVAQPTDVFGNPSFNVSVRTTNNSGVEPIDSLQTKFDLIHNCSSLGLNETEDFSKFFSIYPNPALDYITLVNKTDENYDLFLLDITGKLIFKESIYKTKNLNISQYKSGIYFLKIINDNRIIVKKIIIK